METVVLALRVALSLAVVLGLLWVLQRRFSRNARTGARKLVRVVERQTIGPKASVVVVDADGQRFLLGVTDQSVNVLDTRKAPVEEAAEPSHRAPQAASDGFARVLELATGRTAGTGQGATHAAAEYDGGASPRRAAAPAAGAGAGVDPFDAAVAGTSAGAYAETAEVPRRAARRAAAQPAAADAHAEGQPLAEPGQDPDVVPIRQGGLYPIEGGRRADRTGRRASRPGSWQGQVPNSPLAGSILSPATWKQTAEALKQVRSR